MPRTHAPAGRRRRPPRSRPPVRLLRSCGTSFHVLLERFELRLPRATYPVEPPRRLLQRLGSQHVQAPATVVGDAPFLDQAVLAEDPEVPADRRLAHVELRVQLPRTAWPLAEQADDRPADRVRQRREGRVEVVNHLVNYYLRRPD